MNLFSRNIALFPFAAIAFFLISSKEGTNAKRLKRYFGGRNAQPGEHNWAVSIGLKDRSQKHICGGSIIDAGYILTAAHCVAWVFHTDLIVRSGTIDIDDSNATLTGVLEIISHPEYATPVGSLYSPHDIAILKLEQNLVLGDRMSAIRLPTKGPQEVSAYFAGWGSLRINSVASSRILQIATMMIISDEECVNKGWTGRRPYYICAYDPNGTILKGDSGSPLTLNGEIIGVAAAGPAIVGAPCSFTNVYYYANWISEMVGFGNNV